MSTVIDNAFRLIRGTDMFDFLDVIAPELREVSENVCIRNLIEEAVAEIDSRVIGNENRPDSSSPLFDVIQKMRFNDDDSLSPWEARLWFGRDKDGHTLLKVQFVDVRLFNVVSLSPLTEPYSYWDNSDPDPDVPEDEWKERKQHWDEVLTHPIGLLSHDMVSFLVSSDPFILALELRDGRDDDYSVDRPRRARRVLQILLSAKRMRGMDDNDNDDVSEILRIVTDSWRDVNTVPMSTISNLSILLPDISTYADLVASRALEPEVRDAFLKVVERIGEHGYEEGQK